MVFELVNIGSADDSGDGDTIRRSFEKINESLQYLADQFVGFDSTGNIVLDKVTGRNYGTIIAPISTAEIVIDDTGAVINGSAIIFHNSATVPTVDTELSTGVIGSYVANTLNVVSLLYTTEGLLISYTQPAFIPGGSGASAPVNLSLIHISEPTRPY